MKLRSLTAAAFMLLPIMPMCEGGDSSPTIGCRIEVDGGTGPDAGVCAVYGASGYVQFEILCTNGDDVVGFKSNAIWFEGGGTSLEPAKFLQMRCPWIYPELVDHYGWSWG